MRLPACAILSLFLIGCTQAPPLKQPTRRSHPIARLTSPPQALTPPPASPAFQAPPTQPTSPTAPARITSQTVDSITFEGIAFDSRSHRLRVIDQPAGPDSQFADAEAAGLAHHALAAINAGFFTPQGTPLGLVISSGQPAGLWNSASSLGSGVWYQSPSGHSAITRREILGRAHAFGQHELVQAGPLLMENGHPIGGLEATKTSPRSLILWDGGNRWWLGLASPCTLAELTAALAHAQPAGWPPRQALNLDGGRSSDLWISSQIPNGPLTRRAPWNKPVRNFLVLQSR